MNGGVTAAAAAVTVTRWGRSRGREAAAAVVAAVLARHLRVGDIKRVDGLGPFVSNRRLIRIVLLRNIVVNRLRAGLCKNGAGGSLGNVDEANVLCDGDGTDAAAAEERACGAPSSGRGGRGGGGV